MWIWLSLCMVDSCRKITHPQQHMVCEVSSPLNTTLRPCIIKNAFDFPGRPSLWFFLAINNSYCHVYRQAAAGIAESSLVQLIQRQGSDNQLILLILAIPSEKFTWFINALHGRDHHMASSVKLIQFSESIRNLKTLKHWPTRWTCSFPRNRASVLWLN